MGRCTPNRNRNPDTDPISIPIPIPNTYTDPNQVRSAESLQFEMLRVSIGDQPQSY